MAMQEIEEMEQEVTDLDKKPKSKMKKSGSAKIIKMIFSLFGETITLYGLLRITNKLLSTLNVPKKQVIMAGLSFIYAFGVNKHYNFFKYEWTLMLLINKISSMIVNKIPKHKRISPTASVVIFGTMILYFCNYHLKNTSNSYSYFANTCYFGGEFKELQTNSDKYYTNLHQNPSEAKCCDIHEEHKGKSCSKFLINRAMFCAKSIFKWYLKFYFFVNIVIVLMKSKGSLKKILSQKVAYDTCKKSVNSALQSTWSNGVICTFLIYGMPCLTTKLFNTNNNNFNINKHKALMGLCYIPIIQRIAVASETTTRHSQLSIFSIAETLKYILNVNQNIDHESDRSKMNTLGQNKDALFAIYVFIEVVSFLMTQKGNKSKGVANALFASIFQ